jgi:hypothetical protein
MLKKELWTIKIVALLAALVVASGVTMSTGGMPVAYAQGPLDTSEGYRIECSGTRADGTPLRLHRGTVVVPGELPGAPSNLTASQVTSTTITLGWRDNPAGEQSFTIERWVNGGWWTRIAQVEAGATMCTNTGLPPNTIIAYRIQALNADGVSEYSPTVTVITKEY